MELADFIEELKPHTVGKILDGKEECKLVEGRVILPEDLEIDDIGDIRVKGLGWKEEREEAYCHLALSIHFERSLEAFAPAHHLR